MQEIWNNTSDFNLLPNSLNSLCRIISPFLPNLWLLTFTMTSGCSPSIRLFWTQASLTLLLGGNRPFWSPALDHKCMSIPLKFIPHHYCSLTFPTVTLLPWLYIRTRFAVQTQKQLLLLSSKAVTFPPITTGVSCASLLHVLPLSCRHILSFCNYSVTNSLNVLSMTLLTSPMLHS